jgi:hypothetical protein
MGKVLKAEYDAEQNALRFVEPLDGVNDHDEADVISTTKVDSEPPWMAFSGVLSEEAGEELSRLVNEMFPPWND